MTTNDHLYLYWYLYLLFGIPIVGILIIAFFTSPIMGNWRVYKLIPTLFRKLELTKINWEIITIKNSNVLIEFNIETSRIQAYNTKDSTQYVFTKCESSTYFKQERWKCFELIYKSFDNNTTYEVIYNLLKSEFNVIEKVSKKTNETNNDKIKQDKRKKTKKNPQKKSPAKRTVKNKKDERIIDF